MDRQTLRDRVLRYNHDGIGGLSDGRRSGVTRWRCLDPSAAIADRYGVVAHERTVGKMLRRKGLTRLQPRPCHPRKDGAAQEAFRKISQPS